MRIIPAYGRDYRSKKEVQEAFDAFVDFRIYDMHDPNYGRYINKQDLKDYKGEIIVRYDRMTKQAIIKNGVKK